VPGFFSHVQARAGEGRYASTIVAAVFKPAEAFHEDGLSFLESYVSEDSTHFEILARYAFKILHPGEAFSPAVAFRVSTMSREF
jgi:hypothetical protein